MNLNTVIILPCTGAGWLSGEGGLGIWGSRVVRGCLDGRGGWAGRGSLGDRVDRVVGLVVVVEVVEVVVMVGLVEVVGSRIFLNGCNELSIVQCLDAVLTSALFNLERKHFNLENNT